MIQAEGSLIAEIERRLRVSEPVIKFITVRMDEEEKRAGEGQGDPRTRKKRSAQPVHSRGSCREPKQLPSRDGSRSRASLDALRALLRISAGHALGTSSQPVLLRISIRS